MTEAQLMTVWRSHLNQADHGLHLADTAHPLQLFVGTTDSGAPRMVLRTSAKPQKPSLSEIVTVERYEDASGKWNLSFTLQDQKFLEVFLRLTDDLHARSRTASNEAIALDRVGVVFDEWRRLLKPRPSGLLTMEELRGLIGELWLIDTEFAESYGAAAAIEGWLGPMGLPQDFWFDNYGYCEAKSVGPSTSRIRIASEHQLDASDLTLTVLQIANTSEQTIGAFNLPALVTRIASSLAKSAESPAPLEDRLARLSVNLNEPFYSDTWFVMVGGDRYEVSSDFPRIVASALPPGVSRTRYQLELADLQPFKISTLDIA